MCVTIVSMFLDPTCIRWGGVGDDSICSSPPPGDSQSVLALQYKEVMCFLRVVFVASPRGRLLKLEIVGHVREILYVW